MLRTHYVQSFITSNELTLQYRIKCFTVINMSKNVLWLKKTFDAEIISLISVIVYEPLGEMTMILQLMSKHEIWFTLFSDFSNLKHMG